MSGYPNAFDPYIIPSNSIAIAAPAAASAAASGNRSVTVTWTPIPGDKRPCRVRSEQGAARYGNGQKRKKGPGGSKKEYHDRKNSPSMFLESKSLLVITCYSLVS